MVVIDIPREIMIIALFFMILIIACALKTAWTIFGDQRKGKKMANGRAYRLFDLLGPMAQNDPKVKGLRAALSLNPKMADTVIKLLRGMLRQAGRGLESRPTEPEAITGDVLKVFVRIAEKVETIEQRYQSLKIDRSREVQARRILEAKGFIIPLGLSDTLNSVRVFSPIL